MWHTLVSLCTDCFGINRLLILLDAASLGNRHTKTNIQLHEVIILHAWACASSLLPN